MFQAVAAAMLDAMANNEIPKPRMNLWRCVAMDKDPNELDYRTWSNFMSQAQEW